MKQVKYKGVTYPVVSVQTMRQSDAREIATRTPSKELMWRAGEGIFHAVQWASSVAIVCGKGNNAGDGFVVACCLQKAGIPCRLFLLSDQFSEDGRYYYDMACKAGVPCESFTEDTSFTEYGSVVDCLFGTGFSGEVHGLYKTAIEAINQCHAYVVSADINSGMNGDTGMGSTVVCSDLTVSIGTFKTGHFSGMADQVMKDKINIDIGIPIIE